MKTTLDGKNAETTTLGVCATCSNKKETNHFSSDGWDRMVDWVCSANNNKVIAKAVEWHEEKRIHLPVWCPKTNIRPVEKEFVYVVDINKQTTKTFTTESFAFEAIIDCLKQFYKSSSTSNLATKKINMPQKAFSDIIDDIVDDVFDNIFDNIKDFTSLNSFLEGKKHPISGLVFEYTVRISYVNENFTKNPNNRELIREPIVACFRR